MASYDGGSMPPKTEPPIKRCVRGTPKKSLLGKAFSAMGWPGEPPPVTVLRVAEARQYRLGGYL